MRENGNVCLSTFRTEGRKTRLREITCCTNQERVFAFNTRLVLFMEGGGVSAFFESLLLEYLYPPVEEVETHPSSYQTI